MPSLNKVTLIGHLGKDPELKTLESGKSVCRASMATTEKWKDGEHTEWHDLVAWGQPGEFLAQYAKKGSLVYVDGSIRTRTWEDKEGQKQYRKEINVNKVMILSGTGKADKADAKSGGSDELF